MNYVLVASVILFFILVPKSVVTQDCVSQIPNGDWDIIAALKPIAAQFTLATTRNQPIRLINDAAAMGSSVNLDYWGITIGKMPIESGRPVVATELFNILRTRFTTFFKPSFASVEPFETVDHNGLSTGKIGTLLLFKARFQTIPGPGVDRLAPVMLINTTPLSWQFIGSCTLPQM